MPPTPPPKLTLPPFWKWLMRLTFAVTMLLFLAPTFYAVKYYGFDRPREEALAGRPEMAGRPDTDPDALLRATRDAADAGRPTASRLRAVREMGDTLRLPGISYRRPIECLSAKAALSALATHDPAPAVRASASAELGSVAQGGAVIRR